jgi:hypothetical protein
MVVSTPVEDIRGLYADSPHSFKTATGRVINLFELTADDIHVDDIAIALGNICRYGGHVRSFLSVAEHCVQVADLLWRAPVVGGQPDLAGLFHDAHEAYLGDIIKPLKVHPDYAFMPSWEQMVDRAIVAKFKLSAELLHSQSVRDADMQSYRLESEGGRAGRLTPHEAARAWLNKWMFLEYKRKEA